MNWREVSPPGCRSVLLAQRDLDLVGQDQSAPDLGVLSPGEIGRAERFARARDARRFVAGRAWMRRALGELLDIAPERLVLEAGVFGRLELREPTVPLSFSLAHAGAMALLAVSRDGRVGVDLEPLDAAPDADALASRALAPEELDQFRTQPAGERESFFLERWTAKEALLKAAGIGFSCDPASLALARGAGGSFTGSGEPRVAGLRAWLVDAGPGWIAALATEAEEAD